jgi:hypothetical protein
MRVIHVAPTVFGPDGLYGGGERYPLELAAALAAEVDCELVTFGPRPGRWREPGRAPRSGCCGRCAGYAAHPPSRLTPLLPPALAGAQIVHRTSVPQRTDPAWPRSRPGPAGRPRPSPTTA